MTYNGRTCVIEALPGHALSGFYSFVVTISEGGVEIDRHHCSVPLDALRGRANTNATDIQTERDAVIAQAVSDAGNRFQDIVDAESL